ncbi:DUF4280 domain-containing protein [Flavobacterium ardleyense]|uniref:DUF4280 domain-containing protein n=1 Tax=Flavobacterium ardleyense TaxID=2038737 RepID=A0ABW5Z4V8_9FLAO
MATLTDEERDANVVAKQQETEQNEKEENEQKQAEKSEHEDKYFVVHGGTCVCDKAEVPTTEAEIIVTKNKKLLINSDDKKFAATEEDTTMKPSTATFGKCTLKPSSSGNLPCAPAFLPKWEKAYDKKTVDGKKILTELSTLQCTIGGKISIKKHGQEDSVVKEHSENTDEAELALINSGVEIPKDEPKYPSVSSIILKAVKENDSFKQISSTNSSAVEKAIIRLNEEATFIANITEGNVSLTSWVIYDVKKGNLGEKIIINEQIGASFQNTFANLGTFRIEGYGKPKMQEYENGIYNKNYTSCSIDVEVVQNKFEKLVIKDGEKFSRDKKGETKFRQDFPATFQAQFLFEPTEKEVRNLVIYATDASGNVISNGKQSGREFMFTPKNSTAAYTIIATYTNDREEIVTKKLSGQTEATHVTTISHAAEVIRPETPMQFKVTGTQFGNTLTSAESAVIKWNLNGNYVGTGSCIDIPGVHFLKEGKYFVEAYVTKANASTSGSNKDGEKDDWHFEVSHNDVVDIVFVGQSKVGKKTQIKVDKFLMPPIEGEKVVWNLFGLTLENTTYKNPIIDITPSKAGIESVTCKIGHRKGVTKPIDIKEAKLNDAYFVDNNGIKIQNASWEQKVNIYLKTEFLIGEEINIQVFDQDYMSGNDPVYFKNIKKFDGNLISFKLDKSIKEKTGDWGRLYFKVTAAHLTLKNGDTRFPADKLIVDAVLNIKNAIIGEENASKKHTLVDYDDVSWFYANTTGIKDVSKIKIEIWQAVIGPDDDMKVSLEPILSDDGVLKAKIDWKKIPKITKSRTVYIQIKNQNNKVLYDADGSMSEAALILQSTPTAVKMVENKAAVVVGTQAVEGITTGCDCEKINLIWGNKVSCEFRKKVLEISKSIGLPQEKNEGANWLMAVMALETGRTFSPTVGTFQKHKDDTKNGYVGLIQIGKDAAIDLGVKRSDLIKLNAYKQLEYVEKFFKQPRFKDKLKTKTDLYLAVNYPNACGHGKEKDYVVYNSSKAAYDDNPMFKREKDEYWIDKRGKKQYYKGKEGSSYVWEFEEAINEFYSEGLSEEINYFEICPIILNNTTDFDIVTYHIFNNGKIEKRSPKYIKKGFEKKYKYVYHDKENIEHAICVLEWYNTKEKEVGTVYKTIPTHNEVLKDETVKEGSTTRRVKYKNGDIAEYGSHPIKGLIWRLYKAKNEEIELIKMPDVLNYSKNNVLIKYKFSNTKRRYTGPNVFAGFLGAIAECSFDDIITTTGSCFKEGSCFPSAEHVNGRSVDTIYFNDIKKDQAFVDAVIKFKFTEVLIGNNTYCKKIKNAEDGGILHNSHLHSGNFNESSIIKLEK